MRICILFVILSGLNSLARAASQDDKLGPAGSVRYGRYATYLPNGNVVVVDPFWNQVSPFVQSVGAVYLYDSQFNLISTLRGSRAFDLVGNRGIVVLANGNFVVQSTNWNSGISNGAGAITWGHAERGFIGGAVVVVSEANSLVGGSEEDQIGYGGVRCLTNGHYVVMSPFWGSGDNLSLGAATWGDGANGTTGVVSASNSLVGSTMWDRVGEFCVALTNGNYVVQSPHWQNGAIGGVGAITWGNGEGGSTGEVGVTNSLVGATAQDMIGGHARSSVVYPLTNGNYVVCCPHWDLGDIEDVGAVTWGDGNRVTSGVINVTNSLIGTHKSDQVGGGRWNLQGLVPLTNGNYVVLSPFWDNNAASDAGAITWGDGTRGIRGEVSPINSLVGSTTDDLLGLREWSDNRLGFVALTNGNYVVACPNWDKGLIRDAGAVVWGNGAKGIRGEVKDNHPLTGSQEDDKVGYGDWLGPGLVALTNGNYVVASPEWDHGKIQNVGAVTWGDGRRGTSGVVSTRNSLFGTRQGESIGSSGVAVLTNGHYVVPTLYSPSVDGPHESRAIWRNGTRNHPGRVSGVDALKVLPDDDSSGSLGVVPLTNGHYVVFGIYWRSVGAVTWCNGFKSTRGYVTAQNSLVGSTPGDFIGFPQVMALANGNYAVHSSRWHHGQIPEAGAITVCDGRAPYSGVVSAANSLVGSSPYDRIGTFGSMVFQAHLNGDYTMRHEFYDHGPLTNAGAVTLINATTGTVGPVSSSNSVLGTVANRAAGLQPSIHPAGNRLLVGRGESNLVTFFQGDKLQSMGVSGREVFGASNFTMFEPGSSAISPSGAAIFEYVLKQQSARSRSRGMFAYTASSGSTLLVERGAPLNSLAGDLPNDAVAMTATTPVFNRDQHGFFQTTLKGAGITTGNDRLLLSDDGTHIQVVLRTGTPIPALGHASVSKMTEVLHSHDQDMVAVKYQLTAGSGVNAGNNEGVLFHDPATGILGNVGAREGLPAYGSGGLFGAFGRGTTVGTGGTFHFMAYFKPLFGSAHPAVFSTSIHHGENLRLTAAGTSAPSSGAAVFRNFTALSDQAGRVLVKATLQNSPISQNEGLFAFPGNELLCRKGTSIDGEFKITRILRFWPAGPEEVILLVQLSSRGGKSQALILRQNDASYLILLRTGTQSPGTGLARLKSIAAVDVHPISGQYAVLGTLSGAPADRNQALWAGNATVGDASTLKQIQRLPSLKLRKGNAYSTENTVDGLIRGLAFNPAKDSTGAGGRGLAQAISQQGDLILQILKGRNERELVMLDR